MKKITVLLFILSLIVMSVVANDLADSFVADVNAPLTAAKFPSNPNKDAATNGTVSVIVEDAILASDAVTALIANNQLNNGKELVTDITLPDGVFDVVMKITADDYKVPFAGAELYVFYNPEVIRPFITEPYYSLKDMTMTNIVKNIILAADYESNYVLSTEASINKGGFLTWVKGQSANFGSFIIPLAEMARWPFAPVDATATDWYRTKINLDYESGSLQGAESATSPIYPVNMDTRGTYYYNANYTGPKFDIVGGMKRADGELRFGSVYFTGDTYFDSQAEIIDAGVVCYPSALLEDKVLTLETEGAIKISATGYYDNTTEGELVYTGVLTGLENAGDMYITAKSYITYKDANGDEVTVYSDPIARCLNTADTAAMK